EEFDILKRGNLDRLKKGLTEPTALAFRASQRQLNPYPKNDVRYVPTYEEDIARFEAVTLEQVKELYARQVGGQASLLVVVGDIDAELNNPPAGTLLKELGSALGSMKAAVPYARIARPAKTDIAGGNEVILTPDKANAVYVAALNLALTDSDPDYP